MKLQSSLETITKPNDHLNMMADLKDLQNQQQAPLSSFRKNQKNFEKFVSIRN